jgi:hypothetical protein
MDADEILIFTVDCIVMDRQYSPHTCRFAAGNLQIKIIYRRPSLLRSYPILSAAKRFVWQSNGMDNFLIVF